MKRRMVISFAAVQLLSSTFSLGQDPKKVSPEVDQVLSGRSQVGPNSNEDRDREMQKRETSWSRTHSMYAAGRTSNAPGSSNTTPAQGGNTFGTQGNPLPDEKK
ncbi:MAG: hypothetical protein H7222_09175 [Methylotenera sp.]|nr:hypothetical protein [Oligoflexia bacterium]